MANMSFLPPLDVLKRLKICGDVYTNRGVLLLMDKEFGMQSLFGAYLGIGSNVVEPWTRGERKSIGAERYVLID